MPRRVLETAGGPRCLTQRSRWGAPRARAAQWGQGTPGVRAAWPRAHCVPRTLRREPASRHEWGHPPGAAEQEKLVRGFAGCCAQRNRPARFPCPRRLFARLSGTWGGPRSVGVGVGGGPGCGSGLAGSAGSRAWIELRARRAGKWRTDPLDRRGLPRTSSPGSPGSRFGHPRFPSQGPPLSTPHLPRYLLGSPLWGF